MRCHTRSSFREESLSESRAVTVIPLMSLEYLSLIQLYHFFPEGMEFQMTPHEGGGLSARHRPTAPSSAEAAVEWSWRREGAAVPGPRVAPGRVGVTPVASPHSP